jgi:acetoin:2,6-dichlorophenolindophenol oxidoreductase subunit alpha
MTAALDAKTASRILWSMAAGRRFEELQGELFARGQMPGFAHLGIGEEGTFVGAAAALEPLDALLPTHRGISAVICRGVPLRDIAAEMLGKATGAARGRGGVPHVASVEHNVLGMSGTVGGQFPIALGYGLAARRKGSGAVVLCCFGDGTFNRGTFHEAVNMMTLWRVPVVLLCDNNRYATSVPFTAAHPTATIAERVGGYGLEAETVDGNDAAAVFAAVSAAAARARAGDGPQLVEALTYRWRGHYEGDSLTYRPDGELETWMERDPIEVFRAAAAAGLVSSDEAEAAISAGRADAEEAVRAAQQDPLPEATELLDGLFVD